VEYLEHRALSKGLYSELWPFSLLLVLWCAARYDIDKVVDEQLPPYRIRGYIKERPDDVRPPAKY